MLTRLIRAVLPAAALAVASGSMAAPVLADAGQATPWQIGMQDAVTPVAQGIQWMHDFVNWIIIAITVFVMLLMLVVVLRFNERANSQPSRISHNTLLEVAWTVVPVLILILIAIPSFKQLYYQYSFPKPELTIKATGNQWYWTHEYPDQGVRFDSTILQDNERQQRIQAGIPADQVPRLLAVDNDVVVPVNKVVHVLVTSNDVIHNWFVPSFGSKIDTVPGRVSATWFKADRLGIYFGQCSELCGRDHAFMPFAVRVVPEDTYNQWLEAMKAKDRTRAFDIIKKAALELEGHKRVAAAAAPAPSRSR
jgi:cytochrome c oxidase subunit 2